MKYDFHDGRREFEGESGSIFSVLTSCVVEILTTLGKSIKNYLVIDMEEDLITVGCAPKISQCHRL